MTCGPPTSCSCRWPRSRADSGRDGVYGHAVQFADPSAAPELQAAFAARLPQPARLTGALLAHWRAFDRVGCFDGRLRLGAAIDWCARAAHTGLRLDVLAQTVLRRRIHDHNLGLRERARYRDYLAIARGQVQRHRDLITGNSC